MGFGGSADIFQAQIMDLMASLKFVQAYMDDILIITRQTLDEHLQKMETVLTRLCDVGLKVNAAVRVMPRGVCSVKHTGSIQIGFIKMIIL